MSGYRCSLRDCNLVFDHFSLMFTRAPSVKVSLKMIGRSRTSRPAAKAINNKDFIVVNPMINWFSAMISIGFARVNVFLMQCMREFACPQPALTLEEWHASGLSPNPGEKAVAHQNYVGWPLGMLREHSLLGVDAVDQGHPTNQYQEKRDKIPFLEVVTDVSKYVR